MRRGFRLGSVFGVEVIADLSLFIIATLLTWSLYADLDHAFPGAGSDVLLITALIGGVLFFGSIFVHELSHSLVAIRRGFTVRRIRLFIFGGVSEIENDAESPSDELAVTLAGPAASLLLGILFTAVGWPLRALWEIPARVGLVLGFANLSIAVFNLLPGLPLDGGRMLRALVWRRSGDRAKATRLAVTTGRILGIGLAVTGAALVLFVGDIASIWFIAVGWFLYEAASTSDLQEKFMARIAKLTVGDVMRRTHMAIDGDSTVAQALELHGWGDKLRALPVALDRRVVGVFGSTEVASVDKRVRTATLVRDAMTTIGPDDVVPVDMDLRRALAPGERIGAVLVVVDGGEVVGLVTTEEISAIFADLRKNRRR
jgi:Zn-dependent protease/predicted transcriptional regulator